MIRSFYRLFRKKVLHLILPRSRKPIFADGRMGVEVVGFFHSSTGLGESARLCAQQLHNNGFKVRCISVEKFFRKPDEQEWSFVDTAKEAEIGCRIIHANPFMLPPIVIGLGLRRYADVFNIGYWAWELERIPKEWISVLRYVNAVFTPSNFTSKAVRLETSKPVLTVPHPVQYPAASEGVRRRLGVPETAFMVSSIFSFGSGIERKNPWAVLRAFIKAFGSDPSVQLVLKSNSGDDSKNMRELLEEMKNAPNIRLVDKTWEKEEVAGLIKESDLYVSLHRSEGFGLTIAEAMRLGTPTIASDWSGSTDFCTPDNCFLVKTRQIPVQASNPEFAEFRDMTWADADIDQAAEILAFVSANRSKAKEKAQKCLEETNIFFDKPHYLLALNELKTMRGT